MAKAPKTLVATRSKGRTATISADLIASVKNSTDASRVIVSNHGDDRITFKVTEMDAFLTKHAVAGGSMATVRKHIAERKAGVVMAKGLDGRNSPNCSKAVQDAKAELRKVTGKAATKAPAKAAAPAKAKADKAPKKTADDTRKLTIVDKKFTFGGEGTSRRAAWDACAKAKTVADYISAGGARKYLARWEKAGAIKVG